MHEDVSTLLLIIAMARALVMMVTGIALRPGDNAWRRRKRSNAAGSRAR